MLNHQKTNTHQKKKKKVSHAEDTKGYKKEYPKNKKSQKLWLSHVQVSLAKGILETGLIEKKAMQNKPTFKIFPF